MRIWTKAHPISEKYSQLRNSFIYHCSIKKSIIFFSFPCLYTVLTSFVSIRWRLDHSESLVHRTGSRLKNSYFPRGQISAGHNMIYVGNHHYISFEPPQVANPSRNCFRASFRTSGGAFLQLLTQKVALKTIHQREGNPQFPTYISTLPILNYY